MTRVRILVVYDFGSAAPKRMLAAARRGGWELVFALADTAHARSMRRTLGLYGPVVDSAGRGFDEFTAELRALGLGGIVTFSENQVAFTARLAEALGLPHQTPEAAHALTDKAAQRARLRAAGVDDVPGRVVRDSSGISAALRAVGLPAMVKPLVGASSRNAFTVATEAEAYRRIAALFDGSAMRESAVLVEECLVGRPTRAPWGDYLAVDAIAFRGQVVPMFVTSKFSLASPFRERGGYGAGTSEDPATVKAACDLARRAIAAVGVRDGLAQAEVKLTARGPRIIEVNGRLGGWTDDLANRTGVADPVHAALQCAAGQEPPVPDLSGVGPLAFVYLRYAPMEAVRVRSIAGHRRLREIEGVDRVYVTVTEGSEIDWRRGSASSVAGFWGRSDDLDALARVVEEIDGTDWISYELG
jgi:biotin carboxylase